MGSLGSETVKYCLLHCEDKKISISSVLVNKDLYLTSDAKNQAVNAGGGADFRA